MLVAPPELSEVVAVDWTEAGEDDHLPYKERICGKGRNIAVFDQLYLEKLVAFAFW